MNRVPKGKCPSCSKKFTLELRGMQWIIPSHNLRKPGPNPECPGTGSVIQSNN